MKRAPIVYFLPMHRFVIECSDGLLVWIHSWWLKDEIINQLSSKGWYSQVFDRGFLLNPPLTTSDAALEQLCINFHLYHSKFHIVYIPRLMTSRWRKQLLKMCALHVKMSFDETVWS